MQIPTLIDIVVRVYDKAKFHAKLNLMHAQNLSPVDFATVGSSNFTHPGLTQNVELNSFITDATHIEKLSEWYDARWEEASEVRPAGSTAEGITPCYAIPPRFLITGAYALHLSDVGGLQNFSDLTEVLLYKRQPLLESIALLQQNLPPPPSLWRSGILCRPDSRAPIYTQDQGQSLYGCHQVHRVYLQDGLSRMPDCYRQRYV